MIEVLIWSKSRFVNLVKGIYLVASSINVNSCTGVSCPTIVKNTVTSNSFVSGLGSTSTLTSSTLGSKFSIVFKI